MDCMGSALVKSIRGAVGIDRTRFSTASIVVVDGHALAAVEFHTPTSQSGL
jgi:hypothetical protein